MVLEGRGEAGVCGWPQGRLSTIGTVYRVWASFSKELKDLGEESCSGDNRRQKGGVWRGKEEKLGLCSRGFWRERSGCRRSTCQGESLGARAGWGDGVHV